MQKGRTMRSKIQVTKKIKFDKISLNKKNVIYKEKQYNFGNIYITCFFTLSFKD